MFDSLEAEKTAFVKKMMAEKEKKEQLRQAAEMRRVNDQRLRAEQRGHTVPQGASAVPPPSDPERPRHPL